MGDIGSNTVAEILGGLTPRPDLTYRRNFAKTGRGHGRGRGKVKVARAGRTAGSPRPAKRGEGPGERGDLAPPAPEPGL